MFRTPVRSWLADFDGIYSGKVIDLIPEDTVIYSEVETEHRTIRGTKAMFIGDYEKVLEMESDREVFYEMKSNAMIRVDNPEYLDFEVYTRRILKDPLKNIFEVNTIKPELAKKYMEYAIKYDKDTKYSNKLIIKPYFTTSDAGILILTEDFMDFNLELSVDPENGVVGAKCWISENTSKYTGQYLDI